MGTKYSSQTQSGFDASPPPDDGSVQASNKVTWAFVKTKLASPVLTLAQAINTALVTFTNFGSRAVSSTDSVAAADHMKTIEGSGTYTESLPDATATGAGFVSSIRNVGTGIITIALVTATDTLNGVANGTLKLLPQEYCGIKSNAGATGYYVTGLAGYYSAAQTISNAGLLTLAHGLGAEPAIVTTIFQCTSADASYSSGDRIAIPAFSEVTTPRGFVVRVDATNIYIRFVNSANPLCAPDKTSGAVTGLDSTKWQLYVKAKL